MAARTSLLATSPVGFGSSLVTPDVGGWEAIWPGVAASVGGHLSGTIGRGSAIANNPRQIRGETGISYSQDFYNRIHRNPLKIELGNMNGDTVRDVTLWNAYLHPVTLASIDGLSDGITATILPAHSAPIAIAGLDEITVRLTIPAEGLPKIDNLVHFEFTGVTELYAVRITGIRVEIWPFIPRAEMIEACEWKTEIQQAYSAEHRIARRAVPRRQFTLTHAANQHQSSVARKLSRRGLAFTLPDWTRIRRVPMAQTGAAVDLPDGPAIVWSDWNDFEQVAVSGGKLGVVQKARKDARVMPSLDARLIEGWSQDRSAGRWAGMQITLDIASDRDLGDASMYPTYLGDPVVTDACMIGSASFEEGVHYDFAAMDNGVAAPSNTKMRSYGDITFGVRWQSFTREAADRVRAFVYSRRGMQQAFWLPSKADDLGFSHSAMNRLYCREYNSAERAIAYIDSSGQWAIRTVTAAMFDAAAGLWELTLNLNISDNVVRSACYLRRVRFNADRVEFNHKAGAGVTVSIPCMEVPK